MPTLKQWGVIIIAAILGFTSSKGNVGTALAFFVVTYGLVLGYNGVDLSQRLGTYFSKTE